jgi:hypothetical protein
MDIIIRFMALSRIADINTIVYNAIPSESRIINKLDPLRVTNHSRDFQSGKLERSSD